MRSDQIIYWGLIVFLSLCLGLGTWLCLFSKDFLKQKATRTQKRFGLSTINFSIGTLRVLGGLLMVLASYLLVRLIQILPCALK